MNKVKISFSIGINNIRKWTCNPRMYVILSLMIILIWNYINPFIGASKAIGYRVTPWLFPHLVNSYWIQRLMLLGLILLFCDAPFIDNTQPYMIIRSNKTSWALGQIFYIIMASAIYFAILAILSIILILPVIYISSSWGKILTTFANTDAGYMFGIDYISYNIISTFKPFQSMITAFIIEWSIGVLLGLIIFSGNMYFKRGVGSIIAIAIVLFDTFIGFGSFYVAKFSPVTFARLGMIDISGLSPKPNPQYICIFMIISITIFIILSILSVRKKSFDVQKSI